MKLEITRDYFVRHIQEIASLPDKERRHARRVLKDRLLLFKLDEQKLLGEDELRLVIRFVPQLKLEEEERTFIQRSEEALRGKKKKQRRQSYFLVALTTAALISLWGIYEYNNRLATNQTLLASRLERDSIERKIEKSIADGVYGSQNELQSKFKAYTLQLWLRDEQGKGIEMAQVILLQQSLLSDSRGFLSSHILLSPTISPQASLRLIIRKEGFAEEEIELKLSELESSREIILKKP